MSNKTTIATDKAPGAIGPYAQAIKTEQFIYTSGQLPIDMATGEIESGDIKKATKHCLDHVKMILEENGSSMSAVVKTSVFITDINDFAAVNEVYGTYFPSNPPARSCVQVAALPKGAKIEIEVIALV